MAQENPKTVQKDELLQKTAIFPRLKKFISLAVLFCFFLCMPSTVNHVPQSVLPAKKVIGPFPITLPPNQFPLPGGLRTNADFWKKIFAEYTSDQVVIHDDWYLNVVYEVIDFRNAKFRSSKNRWKNVREVRKKYKDLLKNMSEKWENPQDMTSEELRIYSLFEDIPELPRFKKKDACKRVRAQMGQTDSFKAGLARSGRYLGTMKKIIAQYGLPKDIVYLPMIESTFNPFSVSYAGASGIWQFMETTGTHYGLKINSLMDERRDPLLSTQAAARLLAHNYKVLQSWPLAITAYNHGLQGMVNAARHVKSENISDIINKYDGRNFGFASRNFYVEFVAVREIILSYRKYYGKIEFDEPLVLEQIRVPDYVSVKTLEKYCQIKSSDIRKLNPALYESVFKPGGFIPKDCHINVLPEHKDMFAAGYGTIPEPLKYKYVPVNMKHRIRKRQTLSEIADIYNTSVGKLVRFNALKNPQKIRAGQLLKIPGEYISLSDKKQKKQIQDLADSEHHVKKGETLSEIARIYNSSVKEFKRVNSITNARKIRAGQVLRIPEG